MTNFNYFWNRRNKLTILDMDGGYMGNGYPLCDKITGQLYYQNRELDIVSPVIPL